MEDIIITMAIATLLHAIKNPQHAAMFKTAMLKIRDAITAAYPDGV